MLQRSIMEQSSCKVTAAEEPLCESSGSYYNNRHALRPRMLHESACMGGVNTDCRTV